MSANWGNKIKYSIFGESHGNAIGIVIDGLEPGIKLDLDLIRAEMKRRAPGSSKLTTPRKEEDEFEILSGYFEEVTTGTPLAAIIRNKNTRSQDYEKTKLLMRPGHADYTGYIKYNGFNDIRGGGHFSARITAPLVFAGAIAKQILKQKGIVIGSHIYSIYNLQDDGFELNNISEEQLQKFNKKQIPLINDTLEGSIEELVQSIREEKDSVGGIVETAIINLPVGLGSPFFDSMESQLSHMLFSVPAVKGIEFGEGFKITKLKGSEANDQYYYEDKVIKTYSNNNGGILGGITNGRPIVFRCAMKPTPSIGKKQNTINISDETNEEIEIVGRHDPCIVFRAIPVIEAVASIVILENI